jgi:hypothetical protein
MFTGFRYSSPFHLIRTTQSNVNSSRFLGVVTEKKKKLDSGITYEVVPNTNTYKISPCSHSPYLQYGERPLAVDRKYT